MENLNNYVSIEKLNIVCNSIEKAHGLPNECYLGGDYSKYERKYLFEDKWVVIGVASSLKNIGDATPFNLLGIPLIILRDKYNKIRVFHNVCSHRGYKLLQEPCRIKNALRCPYHSWAYDLNGKLISTPHLGGMDKNDAEGFDKGNSNLHEVRSHIWLDMIFVNISENQMPFEEYIEPLNKRWSKFWPVEDQSLINHAGDSGYFLLEAKCNWKFAIENYCESYHLPWVHPDLNSYSRLQDHYNIENPGFYSGQGTLLYKQIKGPKNVKFPNFKNLSEKWKNSAEYLAIYPNVLLGVHKDHTYSIILIPKGANKTIEKVDIYYSKKNTDTKLRKRNTKQWKKVFKEDISVVEGMQKGRKGIHFDGGKFSPVMDGPTHCFHKWVASNLLTLENNLHEKQ